MKTPSIVLLTLLVTSPAHADRFSWKRAYQIDDVAITVTIVESDAEMRRLRAEFGNVPVDNVIRTELLGFSVLYRREGAYRCTIYLADAADSETLAHETRHCHGWVHQ